MWRCTRTAGMSAVQPLARQVRVRWLMARSAFSTAVVGRGRDGTTDNSDQTSRTSEAAEHRPTSMERRLLVWDGRYSSVQLVPELVSGRLVQRTRDRWRIRAGLLLMATVLMVLFCTALYTKRAMRQGESFHDRSLSRLYQSPPKT